MLDYNGYLDNHKTIKQWCHLSHAYYLLFCNGSMLPNLTGVVSSIGIVKIGFWVKDIGCIVEGKAFLFHVSFLNGKVACTHLYVLCLFCWRFCVNHKRLSTSITLVWNVISQLIIFKSLHANMIWSIHLSKMSNSLSLEFFGEGC